MTPLFEFDLRLELPATIPSRPCRSEDGSSHGLHFPTAHQDSKVHLTRVLPARYVPPSGFGYPLDGFLPSDPCRFCFTPAALLGFTLRSFPRSGSIRDVAARMNPRTVSPFGVPVAEATSRSQEPRFLGRDPPERPWWSAALLARPPLAAPLGFCPSRVCG
jgi:hypothetical protein